MTWVLPSLYGPRLRAHLLTTSRRLAVVWPAAIVRPPGAAPPGLSFPAQYNQQTPTAARASDAAAPMYWGAWGPSATNKQPGVYTQALLATMMKAPKERKYPHWAAAHTKATMGGQLA